MVRSDPARPRGLLRATPNGELRHVRHAPSPELAFWIEHYWLVEWNLREPFVAQTLPHPSVHLVIDEVRPRITGVMTGRFSSTLDGVGRVFGVKFRPGAFRPILGRSMSTITDRELDPHEYFGELMLAILAVPDDRARVAVADSMLRDRMLAPDPRVDEVNRIMDFVLSDVELTRVEQLAERSGFTARSLQRLFREYVGVSPKWVIHRYRLHEVLERIDAGGDVDWSAVAHDLGYFDQAHFIRDFRKLVGMTPAQYLKSFT
ncbi:MAG TPA: helix-turn-helix domain-containing protein [Thermoanaerobaculia bacterium]|jgi:AraC-like DNA-binding protein